MDKEIAELLDKSDLPEQIVKLVKESKLVKRARIIVKHILKHGHITTEELEKTYGYKHPPRAARDVREAGIPLETYQVKSSDGRQIAAYKFGDLAQVQQDKLGGRKAIPKKFKDRLYETVGGKCSICSGFFEPRYLQIDHRIPYEISGEKKSQERDIGDYMLVCGSCNRAKSWSCEHCPNWLTEKRSGVCSKCYWANPEHHTHIALREVRRIDVLWDRDEIQVYEKLKRMARKTKCHIPDYVKKIIAKYLEEDII